MSRSTLLGCLGGLLLALDGLEFVLSRTGILDIFPMAWIWRRWPVSWSTGTTGEDGWPTSSTRGPAPAAGPGRECCSGRGGWPPAHASRRRARPNGAAFTPSARSWCSPTSGTPGHAAPRASAGPGWRPCAATAPPSGVGLVVMPIVVYTASWTGWFLSPDGYDRHAKGSGIIGTLHSWSKTE